MRSHSSIHKQIGDILETTRHLIKQVFRLAGAEETPGDLDLGVGGEGGRAIAAGVVEGDGDLEIKEKLGRGLKILKADETSTLPYLLELVLQQIL